MGAGESQKIELVADTTTGKTQIEVSKTIIQRFSVKDYSKAKKLYDDLNDARTIITLKDLTR